MTDGCIFIQQADVYFVCVDDWDVECCDAAAAQVLRTPVWNTLLGDVQHGYKGECLFVLLCVDVVLASQC